MSEDLQARLGKALVAGDSDQGVAIAKEALAAGSTAADFFLQVIQPELYEIGKKFERLEVFLPELMRSAKVIKAMQNEVLDEAIREEQGGEVQRAGTVVIGTVAGDVHDIGKNMVSLMLQVNGFEVIDLGIDITPKQFIQAAKDKNANIIGMSSLLTTSMPYMRDVIERLDALELRDRFKVIVGGAPVTPEHAKAIKADAYGADAVSAVHECHRLMEQG